jgi:hypothetical protein
MVIFTNLASLRDPGAIYGWARAIAVREAVRVARKAARAVPAELADIPAPGDPQLAADIRDVLARLTPEHRADVDPVRRMRVLAAATPGAAYAEKLIPAPFSAVWAPGLVRDAEPVPHRRHGRHPGRRGHPVRLLRQPAAARDTAARRGAPAGRPAAGLAAHRPAGTPAPGPVLAAAVR